MKKIILGIALLLFIAIGGAIYYVFINLDSIVKTAIEKYGSEAIKTSVRVDKVRIKLQEGSASISGLTIANPPGFEAPQAFSLGDISVGIDINSLTGDVIVIREISIAAPQIFFEVNADKKANLDVLRKNLPAGEPAAEPETKSGSEPKLIIKKTSLSGAEVQAKVVPLNNKEYQLKLPTISMNNLGGKNGAPPAKIAQQMLDQLLGQVKAEISKQGGAELQQKLDAKKQEIKAETDAKVAAEKEAAQKKIDAKKKAAAEELKKKLGR